LVRGFPFSLFAVGGFPFSLERKRERERERERKREKERKKESPSRRPPISYPPSAGFIGNFPRSFVALTSNCESGWMKSSSMCQKSRIFRS